MKNIHRLFIAAAIAATGLAACETKESADNTPKTEERQPQTFGTPEAPAATTTPAPAVDPNAAPAADIAAGKAVYEGYCATCHQATGLGLPPAFPPLAKSDYLNSDKKRAISGVVHGLAGEIMVNGTKFNGAMPPAPKTDKEIAQAITYVLNSWDNSGGVVTETEVAAIRKAGPKK